MSSMSVITTISAKGFTKCKQFTWDSSMPRESTSPFGFTSDSTGHLGHLRRSTKPKRSKTNESKIKDQWPDAPIFSYSVRIRCVSAEADWMGNTSLEAPSASQVSMPVTMICQSVYCTILSKLPRIAILHPNRDIQYPIILVP